MQAEKADAWIILGITTMDAVIIVVIIDADVVRNNNKLLEYKQQLQ